MSGSKRAVPARRGFTLIELMIVASVIGILAVMAIPKMTDLVRKSQEGSVKGKLATLRSALNIYYGDTDGFYPTDDLECLVAGRKYLSSIPEITVPRHHESNYIVQNNDDLGAGMTLAADDGTWMYWNWAAGMAPREWGDVWVGCTHTDAKGEIWTNF